MIKRTAGEFGVVEGRVEVYHRKPETGFVVGGIDTGEGPYLKVIGSLTDQDLWGHVALAGVMELDDKRGELQFRIRGAIDTELGLAQAQAFLRSGAVFHIGPATADAIVAAFGDATMAVLMHEPARLAEVKGITPALLPAIRESLTFGLPLAGIAGLVVPFGISLGVCRQITKRHGSKGAYAIRANPWSLVEYNGVGFAAADRVALGMGRPADAPERLAAALIHVVKQAASQEGHTVVAREHAIAEAIELIGVPQSMLTQSLAALETKGELVSSTTPEGVSLPALAAAERRLAATVERLIEAESRSELTATDSELTEFEFSAGIVFDETQRSAVAGSLARGLTILTGGPGTGKTTIIRAVCELAEERGLSVALMSFTGKAAKRLSEATGREATTIHRYLRFIPGSGFAGPDDPADVVIVDEVSMLDVTLADEMAVWLAPYARLILVGDVDQLPAIGPGNVLGDLTGVPGIPVFRLEIIHRTEASSGIPRLARDINEGRTSPTYDGRTTRFVQLAGSSAVAAWLRGHFEKYRDRVEEFQVLAPIKGGPAGVDALNGLIASVVRGPGGAGGRALERDAYDMRAGDRIIWTVNDKELGLFNGEIGVLREVRANGGAIVEFDGRTFTVAPDKTRSFTLAYALTIHKAQGSEFPIVIVVVDSGAHVMLARRLLYTAVSRARDTVAIVGQASSVAIAVKRHDTRHRRTALGAMLRASLGERVVVEPPAASVPTDPDALF